MINNTYAMQKISRSTNTVDNNTQNYNAVKKTCYNTD